MSYGGGYLAFSGFCDESEKMVKTLLFEHVFRHPFEVVVNAYFHKYTSGKDKNVMSVTVVEQKTDPETGVEYYLRRGRCINILPSLLRKVLPDPAVEVEEEMWLNRKDKQLHLHSYNLSYSSYCKLEEHSVYRPSEDNQSWTKMEQTGSIKVSGLGPVLGNLLESFGSRFFNLGAKKGFLIMEDIISSMPNDHFTEA